MWCHAIDHNSSYLVVVANKPEPVYFRSSIPSDGSGKILTPSITTMRYEHDPGLRSWKSRTQAKRYINSLEILKKGPTEYHLTLKSPSEGEEPDLGSVVVSLNPEDCQHHPKIKHAYREVKRGLWRFE